MAPNAEPAGPDEQDEQPARTTEDLWIEDDTAPAEGRGTGGPEVEVPAVAVVPGVTGGALAPGVLTPAAAGSEAAIDARTEERADAEPDTGSDADR
jgi:hypothetical protein